MSDVLERVDGALCRAIGVLTMVDLPFHAEDVADHGAAETLEALRLFVAASLALFIYEQEPNATKWREWPGGDTDLWRNFENSGRTLVKSLDPRSEV